MTPKLRPLLVAATLVCVLTVTSGLLLAIAPPPLTPADTNQPAASNVTHAHTGTTELASAQ